MQPDVSLRAPTPEAHLSRVTRLVRHIEQECIQAGPDGTPAVLTHYRTALYQTMYDLGGTINAFLDAVPSEAEIEAVKERIVSPIREMSRTSPFFQHNFYKLRGYPGDFETIEIIYDDRPAGADLPAWSRWRWNCWSATRA